MFDLRSECRQVQFLQLLLGDLDRALRVADRDVLKAPGAPTRLQLTAAVLASRGEIWGARARATEVHRAIPLVPDRRPDLPRLRQDRELIGVGPPPVS